MKFPLLAVLTLMSLASVSHAQNAGNQTQGFLRNFVNTSSATSPYLNLITPQGVGSQSGANAAQLATIYKNTVRPQIDQRQQQQRSAQRTVQMQRQLDQLQTDLIQSQQQGAFGVTGHATRYMQHYRYYPGFYSLNRRR